MKVCACARVYTDIKVCACACVYTDITVMDVLRTASPIGSSCTIRVARKGKQVCVFVCACVYIHAHRVARKGKQVCVCARVCVCTSYTHSDTHILYACVHMYKPVAKNLKYQEIVQGRIHNIFW